MESPAAMSQTEPRSALFPVEAFVSTAFGGSGVFELRERLGLGVVLLSLAAGLAPQMSWAQADPTTVTLFSDTASNSELVLDSVAYAAGSNCATGGQSGTGHIASLVLFGHDLTVVGGLAPAVPFQNLCIDAAGHVIGGSVKLSSDFATPLIFSGFGLTLGQGTTLTVTNRADASCKSIPCLRFKGTNITLGLPLHDVSGQALQVMLPEGSLILQSGGAFSLNANGMKLKNAATARLGGFAVDIDEQKDIDLTLSRAQGQMSALNLKVNGPHVHVPLPIPGLLSQDGKGVDLQADWVAVNQAGEIQIKNGQAAHVDLDLASPLFFALHADSVKFDKPFDGNDKSVPSDCKLTGATLKLPDLVRDAGSGQPITLALQSPWDVTTSPVISISLPGDVAIGWNGFQVVIPKSQGNAANIVVDLSSTAKGGGEPAAVPESWQGLYVKNASFALPPLFTAADGGAVTLEARDLAIGSGGVSVYVDAQNINQSIQIADVFTATLKDVSLQITDNHVDPQKMKIDASVTLGSAFRDPLQWAMEFTDSGNLVFSLTDPNLHLASFAGAQDIAGIDLAIASATFQLPDANMPALLKLDGQLTLNAAGAISDFAKGLAGLSIGFKDLGVDAKGHFAMPDAGFIELPHELDVDLKLMQLQLKKLVLGLDPGDKPYLSFTGGVQVGAGLPVGAEGDFEGLKVASNGSVSVGAVEVKADVADVMRIDASVSRAPGGCLKAANSPIDCLKGDMTFQVSAGPLSTGPNGDGFTFAAAQGAWLATGNWSLGPAGIPLGDNGISLFGFKGGVGYKAQLPDSQPNPYSQLGESDYVVYLDPSAPGTDLLFNIGTTIGTSDGCFNFCGDGSLTVQTAPAFKLDLNIRGKLQELFNTTYEKANRTVTADIQYTPPDTLHATALADVYYPLRSVAAFEAHGSLDLLLSPQKQHLFLGWPVDVNPITVKVGIPPLNVNEYSGGLGVELAGAERAGYAAPWFAAGLSRTLQIGPLSGSIGGTVDITLDHTSGAITAFDGKVYAQGVADFIVFSATAKAWLDATYAVQGTSVTITIPYSSPSGSEVVQLPYDEFVVQGDLQGCATSMGESVCKTIGISEDLLHPSN